MSFTIRYTYISAHITGDDLLHKVLNNLNLLRTFNAAAKHASYSLAANELCISQAAVSQQMRQLQNLLGQQLFTRKGKSMLLT
jgi:LysR family glycine cleavage system transcriptional activator